MTLLMDGNMIRILLALLCISSPLMMAENTIIRNAKIQTMDNNNSWAEALCISNGMITYVGDTKSSQNCFTNGTANIIDAEGKTILPGMVDSHMHIFGGSSSATKINLSLAADLKALTNALKILASDTTGDVVYARGWQKHIFDGIVGLFNFA